MILSPPIDNQTSSFADPTFLRQQAQALIDFYLPRSLDREDGGFIAQIADDGTIFDRQTRHLVGTCRYTNSFALGDQYHLGAGCREAAEHGLTFLREAHRDPVHGGYFWVLSGREPSDRRKFAYGHAFVLLAAATAIASELDAHDLLDDVTEVLETRFWRDADGLYVDEISEDWSVVDPYRGQNANMHLVESLLAAYTATGDAFYLDRAEIVSRRVAVDLPHQTGGLLWEHYFADWRPDLDYNKATPHHLIRPYGVLSGHLLEWAKLLVLLERERATEWAMPAARHFFAAAIEHAWDEEHGGFLYAFDLDGSIVDDDKYHWTISEAIGGAAAMLGRTGEASFRDWYARSWDYAWNHQIDRSRGGWYPALTREGRRKQVDFARGKPDFYHPLGACLLALDVFGGGGHGAHRDDRRAPITRATRRGGPARFWAEGDVRMRTPTAVAHEERCSNAGRQAVNSRRQLVQSLGYRGSRRQMLKGAGALGLAAGLGATSFQGRSASAQEARFGTLSKEWDGTTLNVSLVAEPRSDAIQQLTPAFTEATGITVNYTILPYPNLEEKQLTALTQQTGEQDLIHVDCVWMGQYAGQGWLHPVQEYVDQTDPAVLDLEDFMPRVLEEQSMWEGELYGLPFINAVFALYYRTDIFEELGLEPPQTWDELATTAQTIHEAKSADGVAGLTLMGRRGVQLLCTHLNVFGSMGGYYYDENYTPTMATEAGVNSIEYLKSLLQYSVEGALSNDYDETAAAFQQGLAGMNLQWQNAAPQFVDPEESKIVGKWNIVQVPGVEEGGEIRRTPTFGGWDLGISTDSQNKEAAWEFLVWATSKPIEIELASSGPGARRSTLADPELQKTYIEYPVMIETLETALGRPRIPVWPQMNDVIAASLSEVMVGQTDAQDAMTALDAQLADILLGGGFGA